MRLATFPPPTCRFWMIQWRWRSGLASPCSEAGRPTTSSATICPATSTFTLWVSLPLQPEHTRTLWFPPDVLKTHTKRRLEADNKDEPCVDLGPPQQCRFPDTHCDPDINVSFLFRLNPRVCSLSSRWPVCTEDETGWPCVWRPGDRFPYCENHPARGSQVGEVHPSSMVSLEFCCIWCGSHVFAVMSSQKHPCGYTLQDRSHAKPAALYVSGYVWPASADRHKEQPSGASHSGCCGKWKGIVSWTFYIICMSYFPAYFVGYCLD